jgi:CRISPR-associated protein Csb2
MRFVPFYSRSPGSWPTQGLLAACKKPARIWQSRTPFVPPRYFYRGNLHGARLKKKDAPEAQLAECLEKAGVTVEGEIRRLTENSSVQTLPPQAAWDIVRTPREGDPIEHGVSVPTHLPRHSSSPTEKDRRIGFFLQVSFESAVTLPCPALGHSCHFGLGLFVPATS